MNNLLQANRSATGRRLAVNTLQRKRNARRGASVVEFALVAPIFMLFVFGIVEYGRCVMVQQLLTNAAREGARRGVLDGSTTAEVQTAVRTYLGGASVNRATVVVSPDPPSSATFGQPVTVTVSVPFSQVSWLGTPMYLRGRTLTAQSTMRREAAN